MKIISLVENETDCPTLEPKHGLSIYIETTNHKLLFDLGPGDALFRNAATLGVDLQQVDIVIISHGHYDHGGALKQFLAHNSRAKIYVHKKSFLPHYAKFFLFHFPIGLDTDLIKEDRLVFVEDVLQIDEELLLFADVTGQFPSKSNRALRTKTARGYVQDDFTHEQYLIVTERSHSVLFSGCSHRGILNIVAAAQRHNPDIQAVFGGFHLFNPTTKKSEPANVVQPLAEKLEKYPLTFYTCHCTGRPAFSAMQKIMGDTLRYFAAGMSISFHSKIESV